MLTKLLGRDHQHSLLHGLDVSKQMTPLLAISVCRPIKQGIQRLISEANSAAAAKAYCHGPLGLQAHKKGEHTPVFWPDLNRILKVVFGFKALCYFGIRREISRCGGGQFPRRPSVQAMR